MKPGDQVIHKTTGEELRVKKVYATVATCYLSALVRLSDTLTVNTRIVKIENLIKTNVMRLPKFHELLKLQRGHRLKDERLENAIVDDGHLVIAIWCMLIKVDLHIYFSDEEVEFAEGKVFNEELLKKMAASAVKEIALESSKVIITTSKGEETLYYAGEKVGDKYVVWDIESGTIEDHSFIFPKYQNILPADNFTPKAFPNIGINAKSLALLSDCFYQSTVTKDETSLHLETISEKNNFQPNLPIKVTAINRHPATDGREETGMFMPTGIPYLNEMEDMV